MVESRQTPIRITLNKASPHKPFALPPTQASARQVADSGLNAHKGTITRMNKLGLFDSLFNSLDLYWVRSDKVAWPKSDHGQAPLKSVTGLEAHACADVEAARRFPLLGHERIDTALFGDGSLFVEHIEAVNEEFHVDAL